MGRVRDVRVVLCVRPVRAPAGVPRGPQAQVVEHPTPFLPGNRFFLRRGRHDAACSIVAAFAGAEIPARLATDFGFWTASRTTGVQKEKESQPGSRGGPTCSGRLVAWSNLCGLRRAEEGQDTRRNM